MKNVFVLTIEEIINGAHANSVKVYETYDLAKTAMREAIARELAPSGYFGKLIARDSKSVHIEDREKYYEIFTVGARDYRHISYDIACQEILGCEINKERALQLIQKCIDWIVSPMDFDSYSKLMAIGFSESELRGLGFGYIVDEEHRE